MYQRITKKNGSDYTDEAKKNMYSVCITGSFPSYYYYNTYEEACIAADRARKKFCFAGFNINVMEPKIEWLQLVFSFIAFTVALSAFLMPGN